MTRRPAYRISTNADLDDKHPIGGGGERAPAVRDFKARSKKASHNRKSEKDDPSICTSKNIGGSQSFRTHGEILALDNDDVTSNDVFLHVHTKDHDGKTFIDSRSAQFHVTELVRRREEHTQATSNQSIDEEQPYYDVARDCLKGHGYGLGSHSRRRGDMEILVPARPGSRWCDILSLMQSGLRSLRLSCRAN
ncbi:hypothetical protein Scep_001581 [Stephania cephalantha]|uniref:Uncharacterized protein n=1 Tax=Stephania cephalantha TaxID=152367 RepID=A0AAP0Q3W9_9MAGN